VKKSNGKQKFKEKYLEKLKKEASYVQKTTQEATNSQGENLARD